MIHTVLDQSCGLLLHIFDSFVVLILFVCYYDYVQNYGPRNLRDKVMKGVKGISGERKKYNTGSYEDINPILFYSKKIWSNLIYKYPSLSSCKIIILSPILFIIILLYFI